MSHHELAVIIPAREAADTLPRSLESLVGLDRLAEIVVVDDGSTDETAHVAEAAADRLPIRVITTPDERAPAGPGGAKNIGVTASSAPVLFFLDADDWREPNEPDPRWAAIDGGAGMAIGQVQCHRQDGQAVGPPFRTPLNGSSFVTRAAFERIGGFLDGLGTGEDIEWFGRARDCGIRIDWLDDLVLHYQLGPHSLTGNPAARSHSLLVGLRATIERRRDPS